MLYEYGYRITGRWINAYTYSNVLINITGFEWVKIQTPKRELKETPKLLLSNEHILNRDQQISFPAMPQIWRKTQIIFL